MRLCRSPWFDPASAHDRKLLPCGAGGEVIVVDSLAAARGIAVESIGKPRLTLNYQQWGPEESDGSRAYFWLDRATAVELGKRLATAPIASLVLVVTMFEPGALCALVDELESLEGLGLFWYFSGDDVTDDAVGIAADIGHAARRLGLGRISILTGAFDGSCDEALARALAGCADLKRCDVFLTDEEHTWPEAATPRLDAMLPANAAPPAPPRLR